MLVVHALSRRDFGAQDGIHLMWWPPGVAGYSVDGYDIWRRRSDQEARPVCFDLTSAQVDQLREDARVEIDEGVIVLARDALLVPTSGSAKQSRFRVDVQLREPCAAVEVRTHGLFAVARRGTEVVDGGRFPAGFVRLAGPQIDNVQIWLLDVPYLLGVCYEPAGDPPSAWRDAEQIVAGLQLPFSPVHPDAGGIEDEWSVMQSRLLAGEVLHAGDLTRLSESVGAALRAGDDTPALHVSQSHAATDGARSVETRAFGTALALTIDPVWRRALGLGWLDAAGNLVPGAAYDYRVVGRFRRRDVEERILDFHSVPAGTQLPHSFALDDVTFYPQRGTVLETQDVEIGYGWRQITKVVPFSSLRITWPTPTTRVVLLLAHHDFGGVTFTAYRAGAYVGSDAVPAGARVEIQARDRSGDPILFDSLVLTGEAALVGVVREPVSAGEDPLAIVERSGVVRNVVFEGTEPPPPPTEVQASNLQTSLSRGQRPRPQAPGFAVSWQAPLRAAAAAPIWPAGLGRPTDAMRYRLERENITEGTGFVPWDHGRASPDLPAGYIADGGHAPPQPAVPGPGADLLVHFPVDPAPRPPGPVRFDDVLKGRRGPPGPKLGSEHRYRVWSVDAIGRLSSSPALSPPVTLQKLALPPIPPGPGDHLPPDARDSDEPAAPVGVRVRVVRARPEMSEADRALLDGASLALQLQWGWGQEERDFDPWVKEFRVYWRRRDPTVVSGTVVRRAIDRGDHWLVSLSFDRAMKRDALVGAWLALGARAFKIVGHGPGRRAVTRLSKSRVDPSARPPFRSKFRISPPTADPGGRPNGWDLRLQVHPKGADPSGSADLTERYELTIRDPSFIDLGPGPALRGWLGVTAADRESYVQDTFHPVGHPDARPGNESNVAPAPVSISYRGRPTLVVPDLEPAEDVRLTEARGAQVLHRLRLADLIADPTAGTTHRLRVDRIGEIPVARSVRREGARIVLAPSAGGAGPIEWTLSLDDADELGTILAAGAPIPPRFLVAAAAAVHPHLESAWTRVGTDSWSFTDTIEDLLPVQPARYLYRLRLVDEGGGVSAEALYLPAVFRVPAQQPPAAPRLRSAERDPAGLRVPVELPRAAGVAGVHLFEVIRPWPRGEDWRWPSAALLRVPNRPDLYPEHALRLRLDDGSLVEPRLLNLNRAEADGPRRRWTVPISAPPGSLVSVWGAAVTPEGVASRLAGPIHGIVMPSKERPDV